MYNSKIGRSYSPVALASNSTLAGTPTDFAVITKLAEEFADRSKKDIQSWRQAIESADDPKNPKWAPLQDLYEYLRPDGHLGSQMDIRRGSTEGNRYYIRDSKTSKEDPEKTKMLEEEWIFDLIGDLVDHIFYGYTILQIIDPIAGIYDLIPRRNFVPQKNILLIEANGDKGVDINDPAFKGSIIVVKSRDKFGLLNDIVPDLIWKKNARVAWAMFSEKFGIPLMTATTHTRDTKEIGRIETMLKLLGRAAQAVFPQGTTIDIKDTATKGDPYNIFLKQLEYSDAQISKRILGGTMISDNGSSKSQGNVHENTMQILTERDKKKAEFAFNKKVLNVLRMFGLKFADTDEFVFDRTEALTLNEHWTIISKAIELGFDIDNDWLSSTFNFPITGKRAPISTAQPEQASASGVVNAKMEGRGNSFFA